MTDFLQDEITLLETAIATVRSGGSATVYGTTYTASQLQQLYDRWELAMTRRAIRTITSGAQSYTIIDRTYTRADLGDLYAREKLLLSRTVTASRGGMRIRYGVLS